MGDDHIHMNSLIEQNLFDFLQLTSEVCPDVHRSVDEWCTSVETPTSSWPNFIYLNDNNRLNHDEILSYDLRSKTQTKKPRFWINRSLQKAQLKDNQLQHHGLIPVVQWPLMALNCNLLELQSSHDWKDYLIGSDEISNWVELAELGFGELSVELFYALSCQDEITLLGIKEGQELRAIMLVFVKEDIAGFYYLVTHPSHRNRGWGERMVELGLQVAVSKHCKYVVAQLSELGKPVLQKKGFQTFGLIDIFMIP